MSAYADTSFLASLYAEDLNSAAAIALAPHLSLPILFTSLGELELENAIALRVFRKELAPDDARPHYAFRRDVSSGIFTIVPIPDEAYREARELALRWTPRFGVRSLDILHVACALLLKAESFLTFDKRQRKLAEAVGLNCR